MLRKTLSLLLTAALLLCALPCFSAEAQADDGSASEVLCAAALNSTVYYVVSHPWSYNVYTRALTGGETTQLGQIDLTGELESLNIVKLFVWKDQLYALDAVNGCIYLMLDDQGALAPTRQALELDASALLEGEGESAVPTTISSFFVQDDYLYYLTTNYSSNSGNKAGRVSLLDGRNQTFATQNISSLSGFENGKLAVYLYDSTGMYTGDSESIQSALKTVGQCAVFDPETDSIGQSWPITTDSVLGGFSIGNFCYGNGTVYYISGSRIMGMNMQTGESRISAYTGEGILGGGTNNQAVYAQGCYLTVSANGLDVYPLDSENLKKGALRIFGEMGTSAHKSFVRNYPDIPVEVGGDYTSDLESITQVMVSDTNPYDVLLLSLNYMPVDRLLKKGYCADLSADQELWDIVNQMYPAFGQVLQSDGKLYGVPVDATAYTYAVNMELWESLGLTREELPTSLIELLDFTANWVYDYGEDHPDISLFNIPQSSSMMVFTLILYDYLAYLQQTGQPILFNTPEYRALLNAFEAVDFKELDSLHSDSGLAFSADQSLFSLYTTVLPLNDSSKALEPLYLTVVEGAQSIITAATTVMIINPKTTRMEQALLYVKNYLKNLPKGGADLVLFPEHNEPVEASGYQQKLTELNGELAKTQEQLNTADAANRAQVQERLDSLKANLEELEANRYAVTAEQIQNYRENLQPRLFVQRQNLLFGADSKAMTEINSLLMQYLGGAIQQDKMISELDNRLKLMALEDD